VNILTLNQDWFVPEWREAGHTVHSCGLSRSLDIEITAPVIHISSIIEQIPTKTIPDVIVAFDNSAPIVFAGLEEIPIPTIFYSVDTHHHFNIHRYLANVFDYTLIAQKDYLNHFQEIGQNPEWMPLWATRYMTQSNDKKYGAVFVGNMDKNLNPDRVEFFEALQKKVSVLCTQGQYWEIFPYSEIILNQTVKGDLNFRVFEAMMSGAMLLTEGAENGLNDLFVPEKHLVTYGKGNVNEIAEKIEYYLKQPELCRKIGIAGREQILEAHTSKHRADRFLQIMSGLKKQNNPMKFFSAMGNFAILGYRAEKIDHGAGGRSFVTAMKCLDYALKHNEKIDSQLATYAVLACCKYDQHIRTGAGARMLETLSEAYPQEVVLKVSKLRNYLNQGKFDLAKDFAKQISAEDERITFARAEQLVSMILDGQSL